MTTSTSSPLPAAPDEVVTRAHLRLVDVAAGRIALITLDNGLDYNKPNTFGVGGLTELSRTLDEVDQLVTAGSVVGVAITGKPFVFAVGADLTGVPRLTNIDQARQLATFGHQVFRRLGELAVPSFAFINGAALGGGLDQVDDLLEMLEAVPSRQAPHPDPQGDAGQVRVDDVRSEEVPGAGM